MRVFYLRTDRPAMIGVEHVARVDSEKISLDEAVELFNLVKSANFFSLPSKILLPGLQNNDYLYDVIVIFRGEKHAITTEDRAIPPTLKPLLEWLEEKANNEAIIPDTLERDEDFLRL